MWYDVASKLQKDFFANDSININIGIIHVYLYLYIKCTTIYIFCYLMHPKYFIVLKMHRQ